MIFSDLHSLILGVLFRRVLFSRLEHLLFHTVCLVMNVPFYTLGQPISDKEHVIINIGTELMDEVSPSHSLLNYT